MSEQKKFENKPEVKISSLGNLNEKLRIINPEESEDRPKPDRNKRKELKTQTAILQNQIKEELVRIIQSDKEIEKLYFEAIQGRPMSDRGDFLAPKLETLLPIHQQVMEMFSENFEPSASEYKEALEGVLEMAREDRAKINQEVLEKDLKKQFDQEIKDLSQLENSISNYIKELDLKKSKDKIFSYLLDKLPIIPKSIALQRDVTDLLKNLNLKTFSDCYRNRFDSLNWKFNAQKERLDKIDYDNKKEKIYQTIEKGGRIIEFSQNLSMDSPIYKNFKLMFLLIDDEGNLKEDFEKLLVVDDDKKICSQKLDGKSLLLAPDAFTDSICSTTIYLLNKNDVEGWREYKPTQTFLDDEPSPWSLRREN